MFRFYFTIFKPFFRNSSKCTFIVRSIHVKCCCVLDIWRCNSNPTIFNSKFKLVIRGNMSGRSHEFIGIHILRKRSNFDRCIFYTSHYF